VNGDRPDEFLCERLLVAVTGAVASSTVPEFLIRLRMHRVVDRIDVMMTEAAVRFVTPYMLELASGNRVWLDPFAIDEGTKVPHVELPRLADLLVVLPATAHTLAKIAGGLGGDVVSNAILAAPCPVVLVPSMNTVMWSNPAVRRNVSICRDYGHQVIQPVEGYEIATLESNLGSMPAFPEVLAGMRRALRAHQAVVAAG
jgi:phosphopantothenoylcysteine decarboxylase/phosphopantothenate--cysteine ligase